MDLTIHAKNSSLICQKWKLNNGSRGGEIYCIPAILTCMADLVIFI